MNNPIILILIVFLVLGWGGWAYGGYYGGPYLGGGIGGLLALLIFLALIGVIRI